MNFDEWWNEGYNDKDNPFEKDSFGYWAYAGWCAAMQIEEPVGYADKYDLEREGHDFWVSRQEGKHTVSLYTKPEQEPVATRNVFSGLIEVEWGKSVPIGTKLYTTPPKREWVGLTDAEVQLFADNYLDVGDGEGGKHYVCGDVDFARAIEAKLKEKNT